MVPDDDDLRRMQDFIFARELAEVYLLLDHVSERADKNLAKAFGDQPDNPDRVTIQAICEIGWPPKGNTAEQAVQAKTLLLAKDLLNAAAKPANGASIAFTLLVAGDDEEPAGRGRRWGRSRKTVQDSTGWRRGGLLWRKKIPAEAEPAESSASLPPDTTGGAPLPGAVWGALPPSRLSLSRLAYPGLVSSARRFKCRINILLALLFITLILTCALSWDISAGRAILARLDAIETARAAIQTRITAAEVGDVKSAAAATQSAVVQSKDQLAENRINYSNAREDIADWLAPWGWLKAAAHKMCGGRCLTDKSLALPAETVNQQQWAAVLVELLATAVLPLCYGFLGAGAAVVRNIWGKMRDSLLSPRDLTLSLGQLALGAVIGACIGLFIAPGGSGSQAGVGLTGSFTLTPSALSFIAGFGVESVFVALESFIGRVFNTSSTGNTRS